MSTVYTPYREDITATTNGTTTVTLSGVSDIITAGDVISVGGQYQVTVQSVAGTSVVVDAAIPAGVGLSVAPISPEADTISGLPSGAPAVGTVVFRLNGGRLEVSQNGGLWEAVTVASRDVPMYSGGDGALKGRSVISSGSNTVNVDNPLVTATSVVHATLLANDPNDNTNGVAYVGVSAGTFDIVLRAAASGGDDLTVGWSIA